MRINIDQQLVDFFQCEEAKQQEVIQPLWSGYGAISRWQLTGPENKTVIVKHISLPESQNHPRGWNTNTSHLRKLKSYEVELEWYRNWAIKTGENCRIPICYFSCEIGQEKLLVLEDLDAAGFLKRKSSLTVNQAKLGLRWLAEFHALFLGIVPTNLWKEGTYWHLDTRPDEWKEMKNSWLKTNAQQIAEKLKNCRYLTFVHGDAKVANFCFSENMKAVAMVDFQYVGGGCGMKDVAYFLGSCLTEKEHELYETDLLEYYFQTLEQVLQQTQKTIDFHALEQEWRALYPFACADFTRFLLGWSPNHQKLNGYSKKMVETLKLNF